MLLRTLILALPLASLTAIQAATPSLAPTRAEIARDSIRFAATLGDPANTLEKKLTPITSPEANAEFGEQIVIVRQATWDPWKFTFDANGFFTDNVALAPRRVEDFFLETGVGASYINRIKGPWTLESSLRQDFIRYDRFDSLDFDITKFRTGIYYKASWLANTTFQLRYKFDYLTEAGFGSQLLTTQSIALTLLNSWKLRRGQRVFLALNTEPGLLADPELALRHEHSVVGGWSARLTDSLTAQLTGRIGYHTSPNTGRNDWHYVTAIGASYALTDWASIGATTSLTWNRSNKNNFDYRNLLAGAYIGLQLKY
jgi:hypothetical protein